MLAQTKSSMPRYFSTILASLSVSFLVSDISPETFFFKLSYETSIFYIPLRKLIPNWSMTLAIITSFIFLILV